MESCPLNQNCMNNSNLKLNVRYEVHNNVKSNIFDDFGALFSLSYINQTTFPHVVKSCERQEPPYINQFFMLFHLAGVSCLALDCVMNFWHDLGGQLQKSDQKWQKMLNNAILNWSYLKSDSRFEKFRQFWSREHSPNTAFTIGRPVKGMLKIYTEMPQKRPFSPTPPHCTWAPQHMCSKYDQIWSWLDPMDV